MDGIILGSGKNVWTLRLAATGMPAEGSADVSVSDSLDVAVGSVRLVTAIANQILVVSSDAPNEIHIYEQSATMTKKTRSRVLPLPSAATSLLCVNFKVYALCGKVVAAFDPLADFSMETFDLLEPAGGEMATFGSCDFALVSRDGMRIMALSLDSGCRLVELTSRSSGPYTALGTWNRTAVVKATPSGDLVLISQDACRVETPVATGNIPLQPFISCSSKATVVVDTKLNALIVGGEEVALPLGVQPEADTPVVMAAEPESAALPSCPICLDDLECGPTSVTLDCGHRLHLDCLESCVVGAEKYLASGEHIAFNRAKCPAGCGGWVRHPVIFPRWSVVVLRHKEVQALSCEALAHLSDPTKTVDDILCYVCHKCEHPFAGGTRQCPRMIAGEPKKDPSELLCDECRPCCTCAAHGRTFVIDKCRWCCNPATNLCFGCYRVCDRCDKEWESGKLPTEKPCNGVGHCPLGGAHIETGSFSIGCWVCLGLSLDLVQ